MRKWMIVAGLAVLVATILLMRSGDRPMDVPVKHDGPAEPEPVPGAIQSEQESPPSVVGSIYGVVWRSGLPTAARVEIRFLRTADPGLPPFFQSMLPPAFCLQSPFSEQKPESVVFADPRGRFSIPDVPNGEYELRAVCEDGLTGRTTAHLNKDRQRVHVDLEVAEGTLTLRGRARYRDGSAFEGWIALVVEEEWLGGLVMMPDDTLVAQPCMQGHGARTDSKGRFAISGLKPGPYRISCLREGGFRTIGHWASVPRDDEFVFLVDRGLETLSGRVIAEDTGEPVPGAVVWAAGHPTGGLDSLTRGLADEDGGFSLLVPSECRGILADAVGFRPTSFRVPDAAEQVTVRLARAARLLGTVVEKGSGRPLPGVTVFADPRREGPADEILPVEHTVSGAGGKFVFDDLPPGVLSLGARGNGWVSPEFGAIGGRTFDPNALTLPPGSEETLRLEVVRPARIHGIVLDREGVPVPAAVLRVVQDGQPSWGSPAGRLRGSTGTSRADGRFDLPEVVPDLVGELYVTSPDHGESRRPIPRVASGMSKELELRLDAGLWAEVNCVVEGTQKPLAGVSVGATRLYWNDLDLHVVRTDAQGTARLGPLPGERLSLYASIHGYVPVVRSIEFEPPGSYTFEMRRTGGDLEIRGTVRFADGSVPYRAAVSMSGPDDVRRDLIPVGDSGEFRLTRLPEGEYTVRTVAFREQWFEAEITLKAGSDGVELVLKAQEEYEGSGKEPTRFRVLTPDGRPVGRGDLVVHYRGQYRWMDSWTPIEDGEATAYGMDTKVAYWVDVCNARSRSRLRLDAGSALIGPIPAAQREVEVRLPTDRRIAGHVRDENGMPVPGVRVFAQPVYPFDIYMPTGAWSQGGPRTHSETFAGSGGEFDLGWLGDLEYVLRVDVPSEFLPPEPARFRAGSQDVVLTLRRGRVPKLTILDEQGAPLPEASIWLLSLQGGTWDTHRDGACADDRGVAILPGLDPDQKYIVRVSPPDGRPSLLSLELQDWVPKDATVRLKAGLFVKGVVRDPDGVLTNEAIVWGEDCERASWETINKRADVARDGSFEVGPFYPGKVRLRALPPGSSTWNATEPWETVEAGAEGVELFLRGRWQLTVRLHGIEEKDRWDLDAHLALDGEEPHDFGWRTCDHRWRGEQMVFCDLEAGKSYSLYVGHPDLGLYALRRGITLETPTIDARLGAGQTIRGRILLPPDPPLHGVIATGPGFEIRSEVEEDGTFEIRGVPPGRCAVGAWTRTGWSEHTTYEHVEAGESVVIDLRSRRPWPGGLPEPPEDHRKKDD